MYILFYAGPYNDAANDLCGNIHVYSTISPIIPQRNGDCFVGGYFNYGNHYINC